MKILDLRSDTVTKPSEAMRQIMAAAEVGDDVHGDDPTVNRLQEYAAKLFEREAALFVPSGTMGNQICLKVHSQPGDELLCERECHVVNYEVGGPVVHAGLLVNLLTTDMGMITADMVRQHVRPESLHSPRTRLVALENTHNRHGGTVLPQDEILKVREVCDEFGLGLHLDGARIWNAHVATGKSLVELTRPFDSISVCLSKGLGAPVGSIILGSAEFVKQCLRERKLFGGGMRQVGIIAAGGMYAMEHNIPRLQQDHEHATKLAAALEKRDSFSVQLERVQTNIVIVDIVSGDTAADVLEKLKSVGVWAVPFGPTRLRFVTHLDISPDDLDDAIGRVESVID